MKRKLWSALLIALALAALIVGRRRGVAAAVVTVRSREPVSVAQRFLALASARDSVALAGLSLDPAPVGWALAFGREHRPTKLMAPPVAGWRASPDTVRLVLHASAHWCPAPDAPSNLDFVLVRAPGGWRVSYAGTEPC